MLARAIQLAHKVERRLAIHRAIRELKPFVYLDIGAAGGIPYPYRTANQQAKAELILIDPQEDWRKSQPKGEYSGKVHYVKAALGNVREERTLYITKAPGCSSCLRPNQEFLAGRPVADWLRVMRTEVIELQPYREIHESQKLPTPDIVKVDVQGLELEVLEGFGPLLDSVSCVELEVNMEPLYHRQPLLPEVYAFMTKHGFMLRDLKPQGPFEGEAVEFNSFWSRREFSPEKLPIVKFWMTAHDLWSGEFFAQANRSAQSAVKFVQ